VKHDECDAAVMEIPFRMQGWRWHSQPEPLESQPTGKGAVGRLSASKEAKFAE